MASPTQCIYTMSPEVCSTESCPLFTQHLGQCTVPTAISQLGCKLCTSPDPLDFSVQQHMGFESPC